MKKRTFLLFFGLVASIVSFGQALTAAFSSDITTGCAPIIVNFRDQSTGNPTGWQWDFGNGSTSTRQNPSTTYITPGSYTVTLTITDANGSQTVTKTNYIVVYNEPTANFTADRTTGCYPAVINFSDASSTQAGTVITSWLWDFGDGQTATTQNASHAFRAIGSYTVTLTVTTDKGCKKLITKPNLITVSQGVDAAFTYTDPAVCSAPATVQFTNGSAGPGTLTSSWTFGNGNGSAATNPSVTYNTNGLYHVTLFVQSSAGCADSSSADVRVGKANTDFTVSPAVICPKAPVNFNNTSSPRPISTLWQISNGHTDTLRNTATTFPTAGTYTVTLINTYTACTDTLKRDITVAAGPVLSFSAPDTAKCQPTLNVAFNNTSNANSYLWDFGDNTTSTQASPTHAYTAFGSYNVTLTGTAANGCRDTLRKPAYIRIQKPVISFPGLPAGGCKPYTRTFNASVQSLDPVLTYSWSFGDGGTATGPSPSHTYPDSGTYKVTVTITTQTGCTETFALDSAVRVGPEPVAAFTSDVTSACADPGIQFTNQSTGATSYLWQFSDGTTSTLENPRVTFNDTGYINVTLHAINNGCSTSVTKARYAYIKPSVSRFSYQPDCTNPLRVTFTDRSIQPNSWAWDFGDGTTFNGPNPPAHTYPSLGTYTVKLTTTNGACTYTLARDIVLRDNAPSFTAPVLEGCKPFTATFTASVPDAGVVRKYFWNFGDGSPLDSTQGAAAQHQFTKAGNFTITLTTRDSFGCLHPKALPNYVRVNGPVAAFGSVNNSGCKGMTVTFNDSTVTDGVNAIVKWEWDFGDGSTQTFSAPPFTHVYDSVDDYDVKLIVTDAKGCRDSVLKRAFVKVSTLKVKWREETASCPGATVFFLNQTQSDLPYTSFWQFGDGQSSTVQNAQNIYADTGYYAITLTVRDILGCRDSLRIDSAIHIARPKADFTANNFTSYCTPFQAIFSNRSYFSNTYFWDLGPGQGTSIQANPNTYYTSTGSYDVKLVATSPGGCKDSTVKTIKVYNPQDATLTYNPLSGCTPLNVSFTAFTPMNGRFIWDFGDGVVADTTINSIEHQYIDYGDFTPLVILKEPSGTCTIPLVGSQPINLLGAKLNFAIDSLRFCDNGTIQISDSTTTNDPALQYTWDFGDGQTSSLQNPAHQYDSIGSFPVTLYVKTQRGCVDTLTKGPVNVHPTPHIAIVADSVVCVNEKVSYQAAILRPDTAQWQWQWTFPNSNSAAAQSPPVQSYGTAGSYTVSVMATSSTGCVGVDTQSLLVNPLPVITMPPTITKLVGVPVTLTPTYSANVIGYTWTPAASLSCADCPQPVATPKATTLYKVTAEDDNGCRNTGQVQVIVLCKGATVFVPNTFSPNGDGANDMLYVRGVGLDRVKSLRIFNRWGEVVFEQRNFSVNNPSVGWNGMFNGTKAAPDVYIYQLEVFCENSEVIRFDGNITLIR